MQVLKIVVAMNQRPERLDTFLTHQVPDISRTRLQQLLEYGLVLVNGQRVVKSYQIKPKDSIEVTLPFAEKIEAKPEAIPLTIVYEDSDLVIVNKEPGMVVHPAFSHTSGTLVNALLHHVQDLSGINGELRPGIVHRIDKETSGLLLVAKHDRAHRVLSRFFREHRVEREYWAIVWGRLKRNRGTIETFIGRSPKERKKFAVTPLGKIAITHYEVLETFDFLSLIKLHLETGRTHQIRVHMAHLGHPVFGDKVYGGTNPNLAGPESKRRQTAENLLQLMPRQALHAKTLGFFHPTEKRMVSFDSELPEDFRSVLVKLGKKY